MPIIAMPMPSLCLSLCLLYPITMPFLCLLYPITMPMPIIAMPSLSHHYAYAYHRYAFSIPSLCLSYHYAFPMPSLSHHYAYAYHYYAYLYPITMPMPIIAMPSLSHHYAYAYHRYPYLSHLYACISDYLSLSISKETLEPLQSTLHLWGFFFPGLD